MIPCRLRCLLLFTVSHSFSFLPFYFSFTAPSATYTLSLHDALPIYPPSHECRGDWSLPDRALVTMDRAFLAAYVDLDRKSTRLNSSHLVISYAVFCLKKKKIPQITFRFFMIHIFVDLIY